MPTTTALRLSLSLSLSLTLNPTLTLALTLALALALALALTLTRCASGFMRGRVARQVRAAPPSPSTPAWPSRLVPAASLRSLA